LDIAIKILMTFLVFALYFGSLAWLFADAENRGKSGCLVVLVVMFLFWPIGLVAWLVFRPSRKY
jgi:hypothetical protein